MAAEGGKMAAEGGKMAAEKDKWVAERDKWVAERDKWDKWAAEGSWVKCSWVLGRIAAFLGHFCVLLSF